MTPRLPRTIEVVDWKVAEILRGKTTVEAIGLMGQANRTARVLATAGVRHLNPEWSEAQVQAEVAGRFLDGST